MNFEAELKAHYGADAELTALIQSRFQPMINSRGKDLPKVTYHIVSGQPQNSLDGFTSGVMRYDVQLDVWASVHSQMLATAEAVFNRSNEAVASGTFTIIVQEYPAFDEYETDTERYRRSIAITCWHNRG